MNRVWLAPAKILTGICVLAVSGFSQTYTVSAKPGAVNFIEGDVSVNGEPIWSSNLKSTFLNANDELAVKTGRAEVLLTPGVFLRVGENSRIRMIKPSLIETQVEAISGESMVEVDDLVPGGEVVVLDHGSVTTLLKAGLYRFNERSIATLDGRADVAFGDHKLELKKNREVSLNETLKVDKLDVSQGDDLYAWSNTRAQYNAAASYAGSRDAYDAGGYGFSSYNSPGWYWSSGFSSYMWMPGNGAFYSPFGWGFYGPGLVAYAPVVAFGGGYVGGYPGGYYGGYYGRPRPTGIKPTTVVPVNPQNVGVANFQGTSPAAFAAARLQMQQTVGAIGLRTASGAPAANIRSGQTFATMHEASHAAAASARSSASGSSSRSSSGGWSGFSSRSAASGLSSGGAVSHASSGGSGHSK